MLRYLLTYLFTNTSTLISNSYFNRIIIIIIIIIYVTMHNSEIVACHLDHSSLFQNLEFEKLANSFYMCIISHKTQQKAIVLV